MKNFVRYIFPMVYIIIYSACMMCPLVTGNSQQKCTQMSGSGIDLRPIDILPINVNDSENQDQTLVSVDMNLDLCPNNATVKVSWNINTTSDKEMKLCLRIKLDTEVQVLHNPCYKLTVHNSKYPAFLTCWFPLVYVPYTSIIEAEATPVEYSKKPHFYGKLNTSGLDPSHSCRDVCEVSKMEIVPVIFCNNIASIFFDKGINVKMMSFDALGYSSCNETSVLVSSQKTTQLEYKLNCTYNGIGHIKVLYSVGEKYCLKYQTVRVMCGSEKTPTGLEKAEPQVDDFQTFVIFGTVCVVLITIVFFIIVFGGQWLRHCFKVRRRYSGRDLKISAEMPLTETSIQPKENGPSPKIVSPKSPVDKVIKREYLKRVESMEGQIVNTARALRGQSAKQLQRSVTMALLENTDSFYRKKILFFPTPFDTFSRDATNLLKTVFALELNIPAQCCFDREVNKRYMTGDRYTWIETILRDFDRIIVFLIFTTIRGQKGDSVVEKVLEHLPLARIRPHCKVAFLHITDKSENLEETHHGECFHLSNRNSYKCFVSAVLRYCGNNPLAEPDLVHRLTNCKASRHFLRFVGKDKDSV